MAGNRNSGRRPGHGKSIEQHKRDGTYRPGRHDERAAREALQFTPPPKPPGKVSDTVRAQSRWIRNAADERAVRDGCRFNERLAEHVGECIRKYCRHSKGEWKGQPFELTDWQRDELIYPLFGWVRDDGTRRFRRSYIEIPKKNYKSTTAAAIGFYMLACDEEGGAEVFSLGADKDQARIVHSEAINMVEANDDLGTFFQINRTTGCISFNQTKSFWKVLSASPRGKHGLNIHCAIADELHEWYGDELWKSIKYGFRARRQPLLFVITNAGDDKDTVCGHQHDKARELLDGRAYDESFFAMIKSATRDEATAEIETVRDALRRGERPTELPVAAKCNPGLGHVIHVRDLVDDIGDVVQTPSELSNFLRLTYSVWVAGGDPWLDTGKWSASAAATSSLLFDGNAWQYRGDLGGRTAAVALDLSKNRDFTSVVWCVPPDNDTSPYWFLPMFWLPEDTAADRSNLADYDKWAAAGYCRLIPGQVVDYETVIADVLAVSKLFRVRELAYDPWQGEPVRQRFEYLGLPCVKFEQTARNFASPCDDFEKLLLAGRVRHPSNDILNWQVGHVEVKSDQNKNKRPVKRKPGDYRTIDGVVASVMALHLAMSEAPKSYYDTNAFEWA